VSRPKGDDGRRRGVVVGLLAAATFGASTPFAKRLLDGVSPEVLAGLLYLGAFAALFAFAPTRRRRHEAALRRDDLPRLAGIVLTGGVAAPILMLIGLDRVSGPTGSLLLNLEGPFTLVLALWVFGEHLGRRAAAGASVIFGGAVFLSLGGATSRDELIGVALIAVAAGLWAVDNNLTQTLTTRDPVAIVTVKAGAAALVNLLIAAILGAPRPSATLLAGAVTLGAVSYGLSIVLDAYALRNLGAARESAIFATAPFFGLVLSIPVLDQLPGVREIAAAAVMALGVGLLIAERHAHRHRHDALEHDHIHTHDDGHHDHTHEPDVDISAPHSHPHRHEQVVHEHEHVSDLHHRHSHR